jgi:hypothetical protein
LGLKVLWFLRRRQAGASAISQEKPRDGRARENPHLSANLLPRAKKLIFSSDPPGEEPPPAGEGATAADEQTELS